MIIPCKSAVFKIVFLHFFVQFRTLFLRNKKCALAASFGLGHFFIQLSLSPESFKKIGGALRYPLLS